MSEWPTTLQAAVTAGAAAWPLAAGLSVVLWSKLRAAPRLQVAGNLAGNLIAFSQSRSPA